MGWADHKLTYPFTKRAANGNGDLQQALHSSALYQSTLFANGTIAKWAKYKAFQYSGAIADRYSAAGTSARDLALKERSFGLNNIPIWTGQMNKMVNFWYGISTSGNAPICGAQSEYWTYLRPTTYLRALDFENYIDNAQAPISPLDSTSITVSTSKDVNVTYPSGARNAETIKFDEFVYDLIDGSNMYFGIMFWKVQGSVNTFLYMTHSEKISVSWGPGLSSVAASGTNRLFGTWKVFPFLSSVAQTSWAQSSSPPTTQGTFVALLPPQEITISSPTYNFSVTNTTASLSGRTVSWSFKFNNNGSTALNSITAVVKYLDHAKAVMATDNVASFNVAANSNVTKTGSRTFSAAQSADVKYINIVATAYGQNDGQGDIVISGTL